MDPRGGLRFANAVGGEDTSAQTVDAVDDSAIEASQTAPDSAVDAPVTPPAPLATPAPSFVYALGQIEPRFPTLSIEKEFAQAVGSPATAGLTDRQTMKSAISERENRYLARSLCWVFLIEGLETYILVARPR